MLERILKLYVMAMATGVTSPTPHLFGPPGCGKSTVVQELAKLLEVNLHIINVSRISPLDLEGVQMPTSHTEDDGTLRKKLEMFVATYWANLKEGDIVLFDEFLRGFPEVYNGLLDIFTSRQVAGFKLPKVFIIAASNSTVAYDKALEDRLLHLPVDDPRKKKSAKDELGKMLVEALGLLPEMAKSTEMHHVLDTEVLPMFEVLDALGSNMSSPATVKGTSLRKLIGQAQLREVQSAALAELLAMNNTRAMTDGKPQYVFLTSGKDAVRIPQYASKAQKLVGNDKLTEIQALNLKLNLELIRIEDIRHQKGTADDEHFVSGA